MDYIAKFVSFIFKVTRYQVTKTLTLCGRPPTPHHKHTLWTQNYFSTLKGEKQYFILWIAETNLELSHSQF